MRIKIKSKPPPPKSPPQTHHTNSTHSMLSSLLSGLGFGVGMETAKATIQATATNNESCTSLTQLITQCHQSNNDCKLLIHKFTEHCLTQIN